MLLFQEIYKESLPQLCRSGDTRKIQKYTWVTISCFQKAYDLAEVQKVIKKKYCLWVCGFGFRQSKPTLYIYKDIGSTRLLPSLFSAVSWSKKTFIFFFTIWI